MRVLPAVLALCGAAAAKKVVNIGFGKQGNRLPPVHKRADPVSQQLNNNLTGGGYYADVSLGTPPQPVSLILDTGSSDVWVLDTQADLCTDKAMQKEYYGGCMQTYDPDASSTFTSLRNQPFKIQYLDGSGANGTYFTDNFAVGETTIEDLQIGLATSSTINSGLMGIGYSKNVASKTEYPNIIDLLEEQGLITIKAYSLWLNDYESDTGTILFGGVDTKRYIGELEAVNTVRDVNGDYSSFTVALSSLVLNVTDRSSDILSTPIPVILDSGTTLTYLPDSIVTKIYNSFGAVDDLFYTGLVYVDCGLLKSESNLTLDYQFGGESGPIIRVPIDEFVLDNVKEYIEMGLDVPPNMGFDDICSLGIHPGDDIFLLGDTFLRSAYVVYDLTNHQIALAQSNLNATESDIVEITDTGIPDVSGVASQVTVSQTATGLPGSGGNALPTITVTATAGPEVTSSPTDSPGAGARVVPPPSWEMMAVAAFTGVAGLMGVGLFAL